MQWIIDNWLLLLIGGGMVAMHLFGHGGHGGHGGKGADVQPDDETPERDERPADRRP